MTDDFGRITDAGLQHLRSGMGLRRDIERPYLRDATRDAIEHVARAVGDTNPLYTDASFAQGTRYGALVAPPALLYGCAWGSWDLREGLQLPGITAMHSQDTWTYVRPVVEGDSLAASKTTIRCDGHQARDGSPGILQTDLIEISNQRNVVVAFQEMSTIRREATTSRAPEAPPSDLSRYERPEIDEIFAAVLDARPRGSRPRFWEDVHVGDPLGPFTRAPFMLADTLAWIQAVGSSGVRSGRHWIEWHNKDPKTGFVDAWGVPQPIERIHWDDETAIDFGALAAFDYGSQRAGYASAFATDWCGDLGWLAKMTTKFRGMVVRGDLLTFSGQVARTWEGSGTGNAYVDVDLVVHTNRHACVMSGLLTFALPRRDGRTPTFPVDVDFDA